MLARTTILYRPHEVVSPSNTVPFHRPRKSVTLVHLACLALLDTFASLMIQDTAEEICVHVNFRVPLPDRASPEGSTRIKNNTSRCPNNHPDENDELK